MTDSVIPQSRNSCLIFARAVAATVITLILESAFLNSSASQLGSVPNTTKRLRCAAIRFVMSGKSNARAVAVCSSPRVLLRRQADRRLPNHHLPDPRRMLRYEGFPFLLEHFDVGELPELFIKPVGFEHVTRASWASSALLRSAKCKAMSAPSDQSSRRVGPL